MYFQSSDDLALCSSHHLSHLSAVFSNRTFNNYSSTMDLGFVKLLFLWKQSSRWILSSAVTFTAVLLWFTDTVLFNVWQSLSLSFGFWPLFLLADYVLPWFVYVFITLENVALNIPNKVAVLVTDAPAKCAPTICPLWISDKSHISHYFHTDCY